MPEHTKGYLRRFGFVLPLDDLEPWFLSWNDWMAARGEFCDYRSKDNLDAERVRVHHLRADKLDSTLLSL